MVTFQAGGKVPRGRLLPRESYFPPYPAFARGKPLFSICCMQRSGAMGRTLESDRPAALNLKPVVRPLKGLNRLVCEMEMVCAGAGGNETVSFSLLAG